MVGLPHLVLRQHMKAEILTMEIFSAQVLRLRVGRSKRMVQRQITGDQERPQRSGRAGPGEQEALAEIAAGRGQQLALLAGLDALRDDFDAELVSHDDDGFT